MNKNLIITAGLSLALISCNTGSSSDTNLSNQDSAEESDTINENISEQTELIVDVDLSLLEGKSYLTLFATSSAEKRVLIEPACLSDCPWISFEELDDNKIKFACGQDAIEYKILMVSKKNDSFTFLFEDELQLEVKQLDATLENPFEHIEISLSDFDALYMGYYEDSITSINSERLILMLNNSENRDLLRNQERWTAIPCPEDVFD